MERTRAENDSDCPWFPCRIRCDEFSLYAAARIGDHYTGIPLSRGASVQMTGVKSNCIVHIPLGVEGYETGEVVDALLMVEEEEELDRGPHLRCG